MSKLLYSGQNIFIVNSESKPQTFSSDLALTIEGSLKDQGIVKEANAKVLTVESLPESCTRKDLIIVVTEDSLADVTQKLTRFEGGEANLRRLVLIGPEARFANFKESQLGQRRDELGIKRFYTDRWDVKNNLLNTLTSLLREPEALNDRLKALELSVDRLKKKPDSSSFEARRLMRNLFKLEQRIAQDLLRLSPQEDLRNRLSQPQRQMIGLVETMMLASPSAEHRIGYFSNLVRSKKINKGWVRILRDTNKDLNTGKPVILGFHKDVGRRSGA